MEVFYSLGCKNKYFIFFVRPLSYFQCGKKISFISFKFLVLVLSCFFLGLNAQKIKPEFDSLLINTPRIMLSKNISRNEIIKWNETMLKKAENENYIKGIILANINLGIEYCNLGNPDTSLKYLNHAKKITETTTVGNEVLAKLFQEFSQVYFTMGMFETSLNYNSKAKYYGEKLKTGIYKSTFLNYVYRARATNFENAKKDSAYYYLQKAVKIKTTPINYLELGVYYISQGKNLDSANFYLNKAEILYSKEKIVNPYFLSVLYYSYGELYLQKNQGKKAVENLEKSLSYASNGKNRQHLLSVYTALANAYKNVGNSEKEKHILEAYKKFNDSFNVSSTSSIEQTLIDKEREKEREKENAIKNYSLFGFITFAIIILTSYFIYAENKRQKKIVLEKDTIIKQQKLESKELEEKSIYSIDELYESAKSRDQKFYTKFQSRYPDFIKNLHAINPNLQNSELQLLAYIYLKFETKEIADILFLSIKTIQNRKHKIRKKLNIPSTEDIYIWLKSFNH